MISWIGCFAFHNSHISKIPVKKTLFIISYIYTNIRNRKYFKFTKNKTITGLRDFWGVKLPDKQKAMSAGMNAHIANPVELGELMQTLKNLL